MAVFRGSLIPKVDLALFATFSSVLGSKKTLTSFWDKLKAKARHLNPVDGDQIVDFITNLDQHNKMLLLLGGLQLSFDDLTANSIKDLIVAGALGKIHKIRTEKLYELRAPWSTD